MSDEHTHDHTQELLYLVYLAERTAWGAWRAPIEIIGVGSSKKENELLIHTTKGFYSFNFDRVRYFVVEPI
ncbi:MAG: hypothetical protein DMF06_03415 [Verrucomicrobia bacterium]|nr:MAG: hypothetical protein DMF06_03415 [Verrucomicrobiota bacterium]